ncbi:MAG: hypothetical protein AAF465_16105 [Pseudomonadota bacterium]
MTFSAIKTTALIIAASIVAPQALAGEDGERKKRRGPPPVAIEACSGLAEGTQCSFIGRRGQERQGTCVIPARNQEILACKPDHRRRGHHDES